MDQKKKKRVNKATKTAVVFDADARKDFLTGFRKRKNARRVAAKQQMERELKEEIKKAKWVLLYKTHTLSWRVSTF